MFVSLDAVQRGSLVIKTSVLDNQIMMIIFDIDIKAFGLKIFRSLPEAETYINIINKIVK